MRLHSRSWIPAVRYILVSVSTIRRKPCFPPHLVVAKWIVNAASWLRKCQTELRVGCPTIASSGTASILPLTILVMAVTVAVISAMITPFLR